MNHHSRTTAAPQAANETHRAISEGFSVLRYAVDHDHLGTNEDAAGDIARRIRQRLEQLPPGRRVAVASMPARDLARYEGLRVLLRAFGVTLVARRNLGAIPETPADRARLGYREGPWLERRLPRDTAALYVQLPTTESAEQPEQDDDAPSAPVLTIPTPGIEVAHVARRATLTLDPDPAAYWHDTDHWIEWGGERYHAGSGDDGFRNATPFRLGEHVTIAGMPYAVAEVGWTVTEGADEREDGARPICWTVTLEPTP